VGIVEQLLEALLLLRNSAKVHADQMERSGGMQVEAGLANPGVSCT
jgi:hypothetical protein